MSAQWRIRRGGAAGRPRPALDPEPVTVECDAVPTPGLIASAGPAQKIGADRRHRVGASQPRIVGHLVERGQACREAVAKANCECAIGAYHRRVRHRGQPVVRPRQMVAQSVCCQDGAVACSAAITACGRYGPGAPRPAATVPGHRAIRPRSQWLRSCSSSGISAPSSSTRVRRRESCSSTSACERVRIAVVGHQRAQFTGEPDTLVAQFVADRRRAACRPVALGEHRIDAAQYVWRALRQKLRWRHPQRDVGAARSCSWPG